MEECPIVEQKQKQDHPISPNTRITVAALVIIVPMFVWAGRLDSRVQRLEEERIEIRNDLRTIMAKLDDLRSRTPLERPGK